MFDLGFTTLMKVMELKDPVRNKMAILLVQMSRIVNPWVLQDLEKGMLPFALASSIASFGFAQHGSFTRKQVGSEQGNKLNNPSLAFSPKFKWRKEIARRLSCWDEALYLSEFKILFHSLGCHYWLWCCEYYIYRVSQKNTSQGDVWFFNPKIVTSGSGVEQT